MPLQWEGEGTPEPVILSDATDHDLQQRVVSHLFKPVHCSEERKNSTQRHQGHKETQSITAAPAAQGGSLILFAFFVGFVTLC